jgi:Uma2 family endonuclease
MAIAHDPGLFDAPEIEWLDGRPHPKVSPKRTHSLLQGRLYTALSSWAEGRGDVGTEWRFRLPKPGRRRTSFVPDVAFVSYGRLDALTDKQVEEPPFAPDVAIEVRSKGDRPKYVAEKIEAYLNSGSALVLDVNPRRRAIVAHDQSGERTFGTGDILTHPALPGFALDVEALFSAVERRRRA